MPKMRVLKEKGFRYAKQHYAKGETFDAKSNHASYLKAQKIAEMAGGTSYKTAEIKAEETQGPSALATADVVPAKAPDENLNAMTKAKLLELAKAKGIKVDASASKADVVKAMSAYKRRDMRAEH